MTFTITSSLGGTATPDLVLGYEATSESLNVVHKIIGRSDPDITLRGDGLRSGSLEQFYLSRASAWAARTLQAAAATFTVVDSTLTELNMTFVRTGRMSIELDSDTATRWILTVDYQEIAP